MNSAINRIDETMCSMTLLGWNFVQPFSKERNFYKAPSKIC